MTRFTSAMARLALIIVAMILATIALGWIGPLFVALVLAALDGRRSVPRESGTGAALAWTFIMLFTLVVSGVRPVQLVAASLQMPSLVLPLASILFAAGLAWSTAAIVGALRPLVVEHRSAR